MKPYPSINWKLTPECRMQTTTIADEQWILGAYERHKEEFGFIPTSGLLRQASEGRFLMTRHIQTDERIGFVMLTGGRRSTPVLRMNYVVPQWRHRKFGTLQTKAAALWIFQQTTFRQMQVRTRSDINPQVRINQKLGGKTTDADRGPYTRNYGIVETYEIDIMPILEEILLKVIHE